MKQTQSIIIYDGTCNFCISIIRFVKKRDKKDVFFSTYIQSKEGRSVLRLHDEKFISLQTVYFIHDKCVYKKSKAIFKIFALLPFPWKCFSWFQLLPVSVADQLYKIIARYRYNIFGKVKEKEPHSELS